MADEKTSSSENESDVDGASTAELLREVARIDGPPRSERAIGSRLGRFILQGEIGRGGMGIVYRARDESLGRSVALKVLPDGQESDPDRRGRFLREARSAAAIVHPNVATIYEIGEVEGCLFIAMELVTGTSLRARFVAGRPLPNAEVLKLAKGIARGLAAAHGQGIVHRDLKPENVIVDKKGEPKILDFGLAKLHDSGPREVLEQQPTDGVATEQGRLLGTPAYMSPEQAAGKPLDARSDLFSFGIVLYEALTGGRPFAGETSFETIASVQRDTPKPLREVNPDVPENVAALVAKCLAKAPRERFASAEEIITEIETLVSRPSLPSLPTPAPVSASTPPRSSRSLVYLAVAGIGIVAVIGFMKVRADGPRENVKPDPIAPPTVSTPSAISPAETATTKPSATASTEPATSTSSAARPATGERPQPKPTALASVAPKPPASIAPKASRDPLGDQN